jgi:serine/threonine protein kinase
MARQPRLDRLLVLKELAARHTADDSFAERFLREAMLSASLSHPNIVTVHDYFEHEGVAYIAMEYLERGSLRPHIGHLTLAQVLGAVEDVLAGLGHAHRKGIVHRDLKPENLMISSGGRVKIADFGIAKAFDRAASSNLTLTGTTVGTPAYMAPEQAMGQQLGPYTDLYSLGIILYEMLAGRVPFDGAETPLSILMRHVNEPVPPLLDTNPAIDEELVGLVDGLLQKDVQRRIQRPVEAGERLDEIALRLLGPRWRRGAVIGEPSLGRADRGTAHSRRTTGSRSAARPEQHEGATGAAHRGSACHA